jgi:hypothetical protein
MGKVNLMASSTLSDDDNCGHHVAFAPLSHGPSSSSSAGLRRSVGLSGW